VGPLHRQKDDENLTTTTFCYDGGKAEDQQGWSVPPGGIAVIVDRVNVCLVLLAVGCPGNGGDSQETTEGITASDTSAGEATGAGGSTSETTTSAATSTSEGVTSSTPSTASGSSAQDCVELAAGQEELDPWEACAACATSEDCQELGRVEWERLGKYECLWGKVVSVEVQGGSCALGTPEVGCHAGEAGMCDALLGPPAPCRSPEYDIHPYYREVDGTMYLWHEVPSGGCQLAPWPGEPPWTLCPREEAAPPGGVPDFCYCLCGGPP
jgi:hypothetical protein